VQELPRLDTDPHYCVLVPVYNNAKTVGDVVRAVHEQSVDVLVVDDGSTDGSGREAGAAGAEVIAHRRNGGKGKALRTGFKELRSRGYTHAIVVDADGQHDPRDIPAMMRASIRSPEAVVVGVRDMSGEHVPEASRFGRRISNWFVKLETGIDPVDTQSGYRVYPLHRVALVRYNMGSRYDFEWYILVKLLWGGAPLRTVDIRCYYPPSDERVSHFHWWHDNAWMCWINCRLLFLRYLWPLRIVRPVHGMATADPLGGQRRGSRYATEWMYRAAGAFGSRFSRWILIPVVTFYFLTSPIARRASVDLQRRIFGPRGFWSELRFAWRQLFAFGAAMLDRAVLKTRGPSSFQYQHTGREFIEEALAGGRGALLLGAHLGNLELAAMVLSGEEVRIHQVVYQREHEGVHRFLTEKGAAFSPTIRLAEGAFGSLQVLNALKHGDAVAMKGDRAANRRFVRVRFLDSWVPFPTLPFEIASIANSPIVPVFCLWQGGDKYRFDAFEPIAVQLPRGPERAQVLQNLVQGWADLLEQQLRNNPEQWFNFYSQWGDRLTPTELGMESESDVVSR